MEERYTDGKPGTGVYIGFTRLDASALPIYPLPMLALPINPALFAAFILAASAVAISSGPDSIVILRHALNAVLRTGPISVAGVQAGLGVHTILVALGLSVVIASSPLLFQAIAGAGAIYLGWLGIQGFRAPLLALDGEPGAVASPAAAWRHGFFSNLHNPKVILLYLALLPSFVAPQLGSAELQLAILGLTIIATDITWQGFLVVAAGHMRRWLQSEAVQRAVSRATGTIFSPSPPPCCGVILERNLGA